MISQKVAMSVVSPAGKRDAEREPYSELKNSFITYNMSWQIKLYRCSIRWTNSRWLLFSLILWFEPNIADDGGGDGVMPMAVPSHGAAAGL